MIMGEEYLRYQCDRLIKMKSKARTDSASASAAPAAAAKYIVSPPKTASTEKTAQDVQPATKGAEAKQDAPDSSLASKRNTRMTVAEKLRLLELDQDYWKK